MAVTSRIVGLGAVAFDKKPSWIRVCELGCMHADERLDGVRVKVGCVVERWIRIGLGLG